MSSTSATQDGSLHELSQDECWQHLAEHSVGRIAYAARDGLVILPLNYLAQDGAIWLRTASYDQLATHAPGQVVAFEIDHVDEHRHAGWSVLVRGRIEHVAGGAGTPAPVPLDPSPWPAGVRTMVLCLTANEVTGRSLRQGSVSPAPGRGPGTIQRRGDEAPSPAVRR